MRPALREGLIVAALIGVIGVVHVALLREGHAWGDDFAHYLLHARNLAEGQPYAATGYVYNPHRPTIGPPTYPPVLPLALVPLVQLFGLNLAVFKLQMVGFFLIFLLALYGCFRGELGFRRAVALVLIVGLNHDFLRDTNVISSDFPFLAFLYLAIFLIQKADAAPPTSRQRTLLFLTAGVVGYLAFGTRTLGALLIPAMLIQELASTRRITRRACEKTETGASRSRIFAVFRRFPLGASPILSQAWPAMLATAVFVGLAILQSILFHSDRHYLDQLGPGPMALVGNAAGYVVCLTVFWHNGYLAAPSVGLFALTSCLAVLGYIESLRRRVTVAEAFAALYLAVLLLWPSYQAERYLYPVIPLYVFYALRGLDHRWIADRPSLHRGVVAVLLVALSLTYAARVARFPRGPLAEGVAKAESVQLFTHLRDTTSADDLIVVAKPRALALFTGRKASAYHAPARDEDLWDYFRQIGATHLVVVENDKALAGALDPALLVYLRGFADRNASRLVPVFSNRDFTVYRILTAPTGPPACSDRASRDQW